MTRRSSNSENRRQSPALLLLTRWRKWRNHTLVLDLPFFDGFGGRAGLGFDAAGFAGGDRHAEKGPGVAAGVVAVGGFRRLNGFRSDDDLAFFEDAVRKSAAGGAHFLFSYFLIFGARAVRESENSALAAPPFYVAGLAFVL